MADNDDVWLSFLECINEEGLHTEGLVLVTTSTVGVCNDDDEFFIEHINTEEGWNPVNV